MADEQSDPGPDVRLVDHVVREGWDGPGLIRLYWRGGAAGAVALAAGMAPAGEGAVAVRAYSRAAGRWLDDGTRAFKHLPGAD